MPRYTEAEAREAVRTSKSYAEALRKVGLRPAGGNHAIFRRYVDKVWAIPTDHFDPYASQRGERRPRLQLAEILVEGSSYSRAKLKQRLLEAGLKSPYCELCGQGQEWQGRWMGLTLDHINGVPDDNRLENLRFVCPNCAATLDTHCGRKNWKRSTERTCPACGSTFRQNRPQQRYCSTRCGFSHPHRAHGPIYLGRKVDRPPRDVLVEETKRLGFRATGRKYGVSDNAVRKWIRAYEAEAESRNLRGQPAA